MKIRFITIFFVTILFPVMLYSQIYVSPTGDDYNDGSIDSPYQTIQKAISVVAAGGLIYLRDGIFYNSTTIQTNKDGLVDQYIKIWAYPGEHPILDFSLQPYSSSSRGLYLNRSYWYIKGLTVRYAGDNGIYITGAHNIVENCTIYKNKDTGLQISGGGSYNIVINCDSYENYDSLTHGENADGFAPKLNIGPGNEFHGCRAWNNSDDGWDMYEGQSTVIIDSCWAFRNGLNIWGDVSFQGDGNGIKVGGNYIPAAHKVTRSLAFDNMAKGFDQNHNTAGVTLYNNTAWRNGGNNFAFSETPSVGQDTLFNNISWGGSISVHAGAIQTTNSWQGFTVSGADFLSIDTSLARAPRNADGSLPDNDFLRLASGSDLIDGGSDVGLPYNDDGPDLGAFENGTPPSSYTIIAFTGDNGQINPSGTVIIPRGNDTTFIILPDPGFHIDSVIVDDIYIGQDTLYSFINVQGDHTIRATFAINTYTLTVNAVNGIVTIDPDYPLYEHGTIVELTAIPDPGYKFIGWSGDAGGSDNPIFITMDGSKNVSAIFAQDSLTVAVTEGWNMISLPVRVSDSRKNYLFPTAVSDAFIFQGTYVQRESVKCGFGYWLSFSGAENVTVWGVPNMSDTVDVISGWNMVGALGVPIAVSDITSDPPGMVTSTFLTYSGIYVESDSLLPGRGYWVKATQPGKLILSGAAENTPQRSIRTILTAETPPPPPENGDVTVSSSPYSYCLEQNYPNPFNPRTSFRFNLPNSTHVKLVISDISGREVVTLIDGFLSAGTYTESWDASNVSSGVYYYKLLTDNFSEIRKMIILK